MKWRRAIACSLSLNLALLGAAWGLARRTPEPVVRDEAMPFLAPSVVSPVTEPVETNTLPVGAPLRFHWSMVESPDYRTYIANLRAIGCPEETIRDIITADVNEQFVQRRHMLLEPLQRVLWDLLPRAQETREDDAFEEKLDELSKEKDTLLLELLGERRSQSENARGSHQKALFAHLPEEKQGEVEQLLGRRDQHVEEIQHESRGNIGPEERKKLAAISEQTQAGIKQLLTPEEFAEYKLRSSASGNLVQQLIGFDAGEDELHTIARHWMDLNEKQPRFSQNDPEHEAKAARRQQAQREFDEQIKILLGEERFADFQRAQDGRFHDIYRVARRYDLSEETAATVYKVRTIAEQKAQEVRATSLLDEDQRWVALHAIQQETEKAIRQSFGVSGLKTYKRYGGSWIEKMTRLPDEPEEE